MSGYRIWRGLAAAGAVLALAGCGFTVGRAAGETLPARVVTGPSGARLVLVPVYIDGQGPFTFALDTGAAKTVVDTKLAARLGLPDLGPVPGGVSGVAATSPAARTRLRDWRVGSEKLPADTALTVDMSGLSGGTGLVGLLGSDELSRFHVVTIDYSGQSVTLA